MGQLIYPIGDSLYVNLTNRCTNDCAFCVRRAGSGVAGASLWLEREAPAADYIRAIESPDRFKEIVFCGYGEPLVRVEALAEIARDIRRRFKTPIRVDTNGQANLYHDRDVLPELAGLVDTFSISLNAQDNTTYQEVCHPVFGERAYPAVLAFAGEAVRQGHRVVLTVVRIPEVDVDACREIARELGAGFRVREYIGSIQVMPSPDEAGRPDP